MKPNIFIFAGGKSSRFGGKPKILETFDYNKELLNKYFNVFIVTSKDIYEKIRHLDSDFIIQGMGKGSGGDVFSLLSKMNSPAFIAWSDVFYNEQNIKDILAASKNGKNCMTAVNRENPYISLKLKNDIITGFEYNKDIGVQDNSLFFINSLSENSEEFMDMAIKNEFGVTIVEEKSKYFNTQEELFEIISEYK